MTLAESETLVTDAKVQYIRTLVCREALRHFDLLSADVESTNPLTVKKYYFRVEFLIFPCEFSIEEKVCNALRDEEATQIESKSLRGLFD